jgi:cytochrome c-type biogenesis protein CcmH
MITFVVVAAVMLVVALAFLLVPLLTHRSAVDVDRDASNLALLRDQVRELDADLAAGTLSPEQHEQSKRELEARVLEESVAAPGKAAIDTRSGAITAAVLGASVPVLAVAAYLAWGGIDAFSPHPGGGAATAADGQHDLSPAKVEEMVGRLAARLEQEPGNAEGWVVLARTYSSMGRFPEAARAYERAVALLPGDAGLLADYADALGATQNGLAGKPTQIIEQALKADPTQWKALALAGTAAFDRREYAAAVAYWERLKATVPPTAPIAKSIDDSIAEARSLGGLTGPVTGAIPPLPKTAAAAPLPAPAIAPPPPAKSPPPSGAPLAGASVSGTIALSPALAAKAGPSDVVFVFARPADGSRVPLAILRKEVKDLPLKFTLDDSLAMNPAMAISKHGEVIVGARVSKSGNAAPQSGDLEGLTAVVKVGTSGLTVTIDRALP